MELKGLGFDVAEECEFDEDLMEEMITVKGEDGLRVDLVRYAGLAAYLVASDTFLTKPPAETETCMAQTLADLYLTLVCTIGLNADIVVPEIQRRKREWEASAKKRKLREIPGNDEVH